MTTATTRQRRLKLLAGIAISLIILTSSYFAWIFTSSPPAGEIQSYRGVWLPAFSIMPVMHPVAFSLGRMRDAGVNAVGFGTFFKVKEDGSLQDVLLSRWQAAFQIKRLHRAGLRVMLTNDFVERFGEPKPLSQELISNPQVIENINIEIVRTAELAEKYGVELYAPMNEPEVKFKNNPALAWRWAQEILPQIREVYHGKIVWKGDLSAQLDDAAWDMEEADFSGYDYVGFSTSLSGPVDEYDKRVNRVISEIRTIAQRSDAELIVSEFGAWSRPWNEDKNNVRKAYEIVLEEGAKAGIKSYFALDGPFGANPSFSDFGDVLSEWYA